MSHTQLCWEPVLVVDNASTSVNFFFDEKNELDVVLHEAGEGSISGRLSEADARTLYGILHKRFG